MRLYADNPTFDEPGLVQTIANLRTRAARLHPEDGKRDLTHLERLGIELTVATSRYAELTGLTYAVETELMRRENAAAAAAHPRRHLTVVPA